MTKINYSALKSKHIDLGRKILQADSGNLFPLDILAIAALNRSLCLSKAFDALIGQLNLLAAAPLLRLQLDNAMRLYAATLVEDPHVFATQVFKGSQIRKLKDKSNCYMTDNYLACQLSKLFPWVKDVYDNTSGYIHLSDKHIWNAMRNDATSTQTTAFSMKVTDEDAFVPESIYNEAVEAYLEVTKVIYIFLDDWVFTKSNPELARKIREARGGARGG